MEGETTSPFDTIQRRQPETRSFRISNPSFLRLQASTSNMRNRASSPRREQEKQSKQKMAETYTASDDNTVPPFIYTFSSLLQRAADRNDALSVTDRHRIPLLSAGSAFSAVAKPEISIPCYLARIFRFARCSQSCFVVAYVYLNRFLRLHPSFCIDSFNVHRLLITAVLTAVKFMDDRYYNNAYFAKVGGISLTELNYLEVDFLFGLGFRLNVTPTVFGSYCSILERETNIVSPRIPPRLHFFLADEESSSSCKQTEIIV